MSERSPTPACASIGACYTAASLREARNRGKDRTVIDLKSRYEIDKMRAAGVLAARTLEYALSLVEPGIPTEEIDAKTEAFIRDHNAIPAPLNYGASRGRPGFPKATCISVNEVICHGIPGKRKLKEGDIAGIDVTVILDGFHGDTASTVPVGAIDAETKRLLWVTFQAQQAGIAAVAPGKRLRHVAEAIQNTAEPAGFSVVEDFVGHGLGREFHEPPQVSHVARPQDGHPSPGLRTKLKPGMTFTIEPMVNAGTHRQRTSAKDGWTARTADGKNSAQYEHSIAVTADGVEILTLLPEWGHQGPGGYLPERVE